jgi:hypothetical protein
MLLNTFTNIKTKRTASGALGFFQYYSIRSTAMSSIEAVLRRNEAKFAITTQYYQYYQYHPIHSSFGTWLKNRQLPREARGQIGAEDISEFPGAFFVFAWCASVPDVSPVMIEGAERGPYFLASSTLVSSVLGEVLFLRVHRDPGLWHRFCYGSSPGLVSRPTEIVGWRGRGRCFFNSRARGRTLKQQHPTLVYRPRQQLLQLHRLKMFLKCIEVCRLYCVLLLQIAVEDTKIWLQGE